MAAAKDKITSLPTRYEPLERVFGDKARTTFLSPDEDLEVVKRLLTSAESSNQGKILFISAQSGSGKSTFVHSLEVFLTDKVESVIRLPLPHELSVSEIPAYVSRIPPSKKYNILNFDGREAPHFEKAEYQTFLGSLNSLLRYRPDIIIIWPVTDPSFSEKLIKILNTVGGKSAFGPISQHQLHGISKNRFHLVLEKILQVANWQLEDAAISYAEVEEIANKSERIGVFLDNLRDTITERFDTSHLGLKFPTLVISVSSNDPKFRETARSLRRADSYYLEASRLLMYTKKSNVAEWWQNRSDTLKSALPHVIALFNAQLACMSSSTVVHSALLSENKILREMVPNVRKDSGNAQRVMRYSEIYKFLNGQPIDNRESGSNVKEETSAAFVTIQKNSERMHKSINKSILDLAIYSGLDLKDLQYEKQMAPGLQADASYISGEGEIIALEFHHKSASESSNNKIAIYILEKLKEYAINYGLASR